MTDDGYEELADRLQSTDADTVDEAFEELEEMSEEEVIAVYKELDSREETLGIGPVGDYIADVYDRLPGRIGEEE